MGIKKDEKRLEAVKVLLKKGSSKSESKFKEQEEDNYTTIAKGIMDRDTADSLAADKDGMVVEDEEKGKFAVIKKAV